MTAESATDLGHIKHEESRIASKEPDGSLEGLCRLQHRRISAFLEQPQSDPVLKAVQQQTRTSLDIVQKAIVQYRYVAARPPMATRTDTAQPR